MFTYRLRGLLNLYIFAATCFVAGFYLFLVATTGYVEPLSLAPEINQRLVVLTIVGTMLVSGRFVSALGWKFHDLGWPEAARLATEQVMTVAAGLFTVIVATKDRSISRLFLGYFLTLTWVMLVVVNRKLPAYLANLAFDKLNRLPTVFMGGAADLARLDRWITQTRHLGVMPVGYLSDESGYEQQAIGRHLGTSTDLARIIEELRIAQVILAGLPATREETAAVLKACQTAGCRILIYAPIADRVPVPMIPLLEGGQFFLTMQEEPLEDPFNRAIKRAYDIALSLPVVVLILPPLCAFVWMVHRIQAPGPLFFVRPRGGRMRSEFGMVKFRSMYHEKAPSAEREAVQARTGDKRVFPLGQFIRRTSIDEFPQFWNVLIGDMSVVGPRPHLPRHDDEFSRIASLYRTRQLVKPGITGLAQSRGLRGEITDPGLLHARLAMDLDYITRWSIWLDVQVTLKTLLQVIFPPKEAH